VNPIFLRAADAARRSPPKYSAMRIMIPQVAEKLIALGKSTPQALKRK
jgi:hypothetical protein